MKNSSPLLIISLISMISFQPAYAQMDNEANGARMEKLERDLMLLQRQISRTSGSMAGSGGPAPANADAEVRISAMEDQIRELSGKNEQNEFQLRKLAENLEKLQRDTDFRFGEITHNPSTAADSLTPPAPGPKKIPEENQKNELDKNGRSLGKTVDTARQVPDTQDNDDSSGPLETNFASANDHYKYAFRLLNQTQYDKAAESFAGFIKKYPKDPLVGNAYYWQGETYYIRRDYVKAADSFRQGFEELPTGPKAPDNLLKLAMTLNALKRDKEACVVLTQVVAKFKTSSAAVAQKAEQEQKRIDCK